MIAALVFAAVYVAVMGLATLPATIAWARGIPTGTQGAFRRSR